MSCSRKCAEAKAWHRMMSFGQLLYSTLQIRDLAVEVYRKMLGAGVKDDVVAYDNTLINESSKVGNLVAARELFDEMKSSGPMPDKITYTALIDGLCKEGDIESTLAVRKEMVQQGVELDEVAFTAFTMGLCRAGECLRLQSQKLEKSVTMDITEDPLANSMANLFTNLSSMGMNNQLELLEKMNARVTKEYSGFGDVASGLKVFVEQLSSKSGMFDDFVKEIDAIERKVEVFEAVVSLLDKHVTLLESKVQSVVCQNFS
ncbi:hypothetical protein MLD38_033773 [Melastoma candidum]|uniref:Uncharacterized protein n=1 Tax=Melastoma candidum TaxID=119954 RepID=A0ACB9M9N6_9MYRT|nr:hypothetical protein MLD38_033773 [Melastoma candidum]